MHEACPLLTTRRSRSGHFKVVGPDVEGVKVKRHQQFGGGSRSTPVAGAAVVQHVQHLDPEFLGQVLDHRRFLVAPFLPDHGLASSRGRYL